MQSYLLIAEPQSNFADARKALHQISHHKIIKHSNKVSYQITEGIVRAATWENDLTSILHGTIDSRCCSRREDYLWI